MKITQDEIDSNAVILFENTHKGSVFMCKGQAYMQCYGTYRAAFNLASGEVTGFEPDDEVTPVYSHLHIEQTNYGIVANHVGDVEEARATRKPKKSRHNELMKTDLVYAKMQDDLDEYYESIGGGA